MTSTELEFFRSIADYAAARYQTEAPTPQVLEGLIVGYLAGSQRPSMSIGRLCDILEGFSRLEVEGEGPYHSLYQAAQGLIMYRERIVRPEAPIDW